MIDQNLVTYLRQLGTDAAARVHVGNVPQGSRLPAIVVNRVTGTTPRTTNNTKLLTRTTFTVGVIATDHASAFAVASQIREGSGGLDGFKGLMPHDPRTAIEKSDTRVHSCRCSSEPQLFEEIDGNKALRAVSQDFFFVHSEVET